MDHATELELIDELLELKARGSHYLDETVTRSPVENYISDERFQLEQARILRRLPNAAAHISELANPGDFLRREIAGLPVLLTRDKSGGINAFLNVCRHRGTRLVDEEAGCKHRFSCPYHAWTYSSEGDLLAAPHFENGFDGIDKTDLGLKRLDCQVRFGFVWVTPESDDPVDLNAHFGDLANELDALKIDDMFVAHQDVRERAANWKILVEGGIEAYHFKVAHRTTIGPHFEDNLSSYRVFGSHMRSILMRTSMSKLTPDTRDSWRLRDHAQVLYLLFPTSSLLVQQDHIAWIKQEPISAGVSRITMATLAPNADADNTEHWARNHHITSTTLEEDFVIGESIQSTLSSGANDELIFGRFEGALDAFNKAIDTHLTGAPIHVAAE